MNLDTQQGEWIIFTGQGGSEGEVEEAKQSLGVGGRYKVIAVEVGALESRVLLNEGYYNTAMFRNEEGND